MKLAPAGPILQGGEVEHGDDLTPIEPDHTGSPDHHRMYYNARPVPLGPPRDSCRTVQRFFSTVIPWATLFWVFFRQHIYCPEDIYLLAGDAVVVTKAGKRIHGGHDRIAVFLLVYLYTVCTGLSARMFSWPQSATLRNFSDSIKI
jgi:hypothetical protein